MKKILFILGVTFSAYSYSSPEFSISINDIDSQYANNPLYLKNEQGFYYFTLIPTLFIGVDTNGLKISGGLISFDGNGNFRQATLLLENKKDVIIFSERMKKKFNIKDSYDNLYIAEDDCYQCFDLEKNQGFCIKNRPDIHKISVTVFKL